MKFILIFVVLLLANTIGFSQQKFIVKIANQFLIGLTDSQRLKAQYDFGNEERYSWHFTPLQTRKGIQLNDLSVQQREMAFSILRYYLSDSTYKQAEEIMSLEKVLHQLENRPAGSWNRDPGRYAFIFFGQPDEKKAWGWRFEGHHISFTFSSVNNRLVSATPGFMGANPAVVLSGPSKGKEIFIKEVTAGFKFIQTFSTTQLSKAVLKETVPTEIITNISRKAIISSTEGIKYADLTKEQQQQFLSLLKMYINRYAKKFADDMMLEIKQSGMENLIFCWAGNTQRTTGKPFYYRIQGPTIIIELDNSQNDANHVHTVIRDLKHDFGGDELLQHYQNDHK